jgi:hypothetical protein
MEGSEGEKHLGGRRRDEGGGRGCEREVWRVSRKQKVANNQRRRIA